MTTLIAWVSYDPKFAAAYMASDSRITWYNSSSRRWDAGRKIFPSKLFPDILGYSGDVVFPALALSQIIEAADCGLMFTPASTPWERHESIFQTLRTSFDYRHQAEDRDFSILHLSGYDSSPSRTVHAWSIEYSAGSNSWKDRSLAIPSTTGVIERLGTGGNTAKDHLQRWNRIAPYSREIFASFCDAIGSGDDALSGGPPQLAGFYTKGAARAFGISMNGKAFVNGLPLIAPTMMSPDFEWRDELFQRVDIETRTLVKGAQVHVRPRGA